MRIENEARSRGVEVNWKPFLLGPIFQQQGWETSPFTIYPNKGQHMWRDVERRAERFEIPFRRPALDEPRAFPQHSVLAARAAIAALHEPWGQDFCRRVFAAAFVHGLDISNPNVIGDCIDTAGGVDQIYLQMAHSNTQKSTLRQHVEQAQNLGMFGAPSFTVDGELFWGDDRLEDALEWALRS